MNKISDTQITVQPQSEPEDMYKLIKQCIAVSVLMHCEVILDYDGTALFLNPGSEASKCYRNYKDLSD